jgi:KGK domain
MSFAFHPIDDAETVVQLSNHREIGNVISPLCQVHDLLEIAEVSIFNRFSNAQTSAPSTLSQVQEAHWLRHGVECQILQPGNHWRRGRIRLRVTLEFAEDTSTAGDAHTLGESLDLGDIEQRLKDMI